VAKDFAKQDLGEGLEFFVEHSRGWPITFPMPTLSRSVSGYSAIFRWCSFSCFVGNLVLVGTALHRWGAVEIRADITEVYGLTIWAAILLVAVQLSFPWLGLDLREDALERKNSGSVIAWCGATTAVASIYAGGSIGEGPSYSNNLFSFAVGLAGLFILWLLFELGGRISISISEERDLGAGLRLAGFLIALGVILGRSVAGNWHSEIETVRDFVHDGWGSVVLCAAAILVERIVRPSRERPFSPWVVFGLLPALFYLAAAGFWLWHLGAWEGMP
jgi:hypothetical protein